MASKRKKIVGISIIVILILAIVFVVVRISTKSSDTKAITATRESTDNYSLKDDPSFAIATTKTYDEVNPEGKVINQHQLIASSDTYELYFYEPTLSVIIRNKETGSCMESTIYEDDGKNNKSWTGALKSGIVLNIINGLNDSVQADFINNKTTMKVTLTGQGFYAQVYFDEIGIGFDVYAMLKDDEFIVEIPDDSIVEKIPDFYINAINVYPYMGSSYLDERDGYMFIPDGNGALIYLNNKEGRISGGFSQMIYGTDTGFANGSVESLLYGTYQTVNDSENVLAPIFGMVHTDQQIGYLGIVEAGQSRASIEAYPNGSTINYNRIYSKFYMRRIYQQPTSNSNSNMLDKVEDDRSHYNIRVKYCFVSGDAANYSGLAVKYRNYLLNEVGLTKKDSTYNTRIDFLGSDREEWMITTKSVPMTTIDNIKEIYSDLSEGGVTSIFSLYKGWQDGGIYNLPVTDVDVDHHLGSKKDLEKLASDAADQGIQFYLYQDSLRINPDENNARFNIVKRVDKRVYEEKTYMSVYNKFKYLIPSRTDYLLNNIVKKYEKSGLNNLALAGISNHIYSYYYSGTYYTRADALNSYLDTIQSVDETMNVVLEQPFEYLWNNTSAFLDMPSGTSKYYYTDEEIPFMSMVLKGVMPIYSEYVNFEANKQEFFLDLVEMGIYPSFYITYEDSSDLIYTNSSDVYSSRYDIYRDTIIEYNDELKAVNDQVAGACIMIRDTLDSGLVRVVYDNGVQILVNKTETDITDGEEVIHAMSYKVGDVNE